MPTCAGALILGYRIARPDGLSRTMLVQEQAARWHGLAGYGTVVASPDTQVE